MRRLYHTKIGVQNTLNKLLTYKTSFENEPYSEKKRSVGEKKCCKCSHCKDNTKKGKCNILAPPISKEQAKFNLLMRFHLEP